MTPGDSRLVEALRAEHAAIWGYGIVGAHTTGAHVQAAVAADAAHRTRRDQLMLLLSTKGVTAPEAQTTYALPFAVAAEADALRLAAALEDRTAAYWSRALPDTSGEERRFALSALTDCATRAVQWRRLGGGTPLTVAFPGQG